jgi:hypothetical protein
VDAHCVSQVALETDLTPIDDGGNRHLKLGVAIDVDRPLGLPRTLTTTDAEWIGFEGLVRQEFPKFEREAAQKAGASLPREGAGSKVNLEEAWAVDVAGDVYFIASKAYEAPTSPPPGCELVTILTGWLTRDPYGRRVLVDATPYIDDCDGKEVRTGLPLATLEMDGRNFWVVQEHGYEDETYEIIELSSRGAERLLTFEGGGC